jgi:hypothetical protein
MGPGSRSRSGEYVITVAKPSIQEQVTVPDATVTFRATPCSGYARASAGQVSAAIPSEENQRMPVDPTYLPGELLELAPAMEIALEQLKARLGPFLASGR